MGKLNAQIWPVHTEPLVAAAMTSQPAHWLASHSKKVRGHPG